MALRCEAPKKLLNLRPLSTMLSTRRGTTPKVGESTLLNVYRLTARKLFIYRQNIERRMMKDRLGGQRNESRFTLTGDLPSDRRAANQALNIEFVKNMR